MEYQNDQITPHYLQIQDISNQDVAPHPSTNYENNQLYEKPQFNQFSDQNINMSTQQCQNEQYFMAPLQPLKDLMKNNKIIIPIQGRHLNCFLFLVVLTFSIISLIIIPSYHKIYYGIFFTLNNILFLYAEKYQVEIIKDEIQNKIKIVIKTYFYISKKKYEFDIGSVYFKVLGSGNNHILFILNNHKNKNEINFNSSNISNIPLKSLIYIKNIDVYK